MSGRSLPFRPVNSEGGCCNRETNQRTIGVRIVSLAWRCENVFFENSFYHFGPGAGVLVDAANSVIGDKMLYASAYPFSPIGETLERFRALPFKPDVAEKVLYINADKLLRRIANSRATASIGPHR